MTPCIFNLGTGEIIIILIVVLLLFGAKRIPELARSMGRGVRSFKEGMSDADITDKPEKSDKPDEDK